MLCSSGQIWPTVHVVSLSLSSRRYYFCFIVLSFFKNDSNGPKNGKHVLHCEEGSHDQDAKTHSEEG